MRARPYTHSQPGRLRSISIILVLLPVCLLIVVVPYLAIPESSTEVLLGESSRGRAAMTGFTHPIEVQHTDQPLEEWRISRPGGYPRLIVEFGVAAESSRLGVLAPSPAQRVQVRPFIKTVTTEGGDSANGDLDAALSREFGAGWNTGENEIFDQFVRSFIEADVVSFMKVNIGYNAEHSGVPVSGWTTTGGVGTGRPLTVEYTQSINRWAYLGRPLLLALGLWAFASVGICGFMVTRGKRAAMC